MYKDHFLTSIFSPEDFKEAELAIILSKFTRVNFPKKGYLLEEFQASKYYWFLETGYARSFVHDTSGKDITTNFFAPTNIVIDWPSFFLRNQTRENIQALTDCVAWQLDFENFQYLFHSIETFREHGRKRLVSSYFSLKKHHVSLIADQAKERYQELLKTQPHIVQNASLQHIATYLGITKYSLSRIRKELSQ